jgi:ribose transport system ATP-binding protein
MKSDPGARVELVGVSKSYPGVKALDGVSLTLEPGTVTALAGENGAGKSTFIKVLAGAVEPDAGGILLDGVPMPADPSAVIDAGVSVIYQELTDVPDMTVAENLVLGRPPCRGGITRRAEIRRTAREALDRVGLAGLRLDRPIRLLSPAQRQLVEIARCLARDARVLVFDEPTSSLPESEVDALLATIGSLKAAGMTILYISHHLDELFAIGDRIAVLRDGVLVESRPTARWTQDQLVRTMLAKDLEHAYPYTRREPGDVVLSVDHLAAPGVKDASLTARSREIVGLVGLAGAGRTELMRAVAGFSRSVRGEVTVCGKPLRPGRSHEAGRRGVVYASEDRKNEGLVLGATIEDNLSYGLYGPISRLGFVRRRKQYEHARLAMGRFGIRAVSPRQQVDKLSGGNQQKVVLARVAAHRPKVVLLDDPTRGVDVGAKWGIHERVLELADAGATVVLTSCDTDEVLAVADRVYIMRAGRVVGHVERASFDRAGILQLAASG